MNKILSYYLKNKEGYKVKSFFYITYLFVLTFFCASFLFNV